MAVVIVRILGSCLWTPSIDKFSFNVKLSNILILDQWLKWKYFCVFFLFYIMDVKKRVKIKMTSTQKDNSLNLQKDLLLHKKLLVKHTNHHWYMFLYLNFWFYATASCHIYFNSISIFIFILGALAGGIWQIRCKINNSIMKLEYFVVSQFQIRNNFPKFMTHTKNFNNHKPIDNNKPLQNRLF